MYCTAHVDLGGTWLVPPAHPQGPTQHLCFSVLLNPSVSAVITPVHSKDFTPPLRGVVLFLFYIILLT